MSFQEPPLPNLLLLLVQSVSSIIDAFVIYPKQPCSTEHLPLPRLGRDSEVQSWSAPAAGCTGASWRFGPRHSASCFLRVTSSGTMQADHTLGAGPRAPAACHQLIRHWNDSGPGPPYMLVILSSNWAAASPVTESACVQTQRIPCNTLGIPCIPSHVRQSHSKRRPCFDLNFPFLMLSLLQRPLQTPLMICQRSFETPLMVSQRPF